MDNNDKNGIDPDRPWLDLENILSGEDGASFARAIDEAFPIEPVKKGSSTSPLNIDKTVHAKTRRKRRGLRSMSKILNAEYYDATRSLRLSAPLEGFADREKVLVTVEHADAKRPWSDLRGLLSGKEGEEFARVIKEAFPVEPVKK
jgi:hypothetical protein